MKNSKKDAYEGYIGRARAKLEQLGIRVWSDVKITNDAGSVFEGVILPRSGNFNDLHIVVKMRTGYNIGVHIDRIVSAEEVGYKEAVYKIPEKEFPRDVKLSRMMMATRIVPQTMRS